MLGEWTEVFYVMNVLAYNKNTEVPLDSPCVKSGPCMHTRYVIETKCSRCSVEIVYVVTEVTAFAKKVKAGLLLTRLFRCSVFS